MLKFLSTVPFGIDKTSGKVGLVKDVGENALDFYKLKVTAETADDGEKVTTEIEIAVVDKEEERPRPRRSYAFRVKENARDALVANLSELDFGQEKGEIVTDVLILNNEAKERFTVTDKGLLFTKVRIGKCALVTAKRLRDLPPSLGESRNLCT